MPGEYPIPDNVASFTIAADNPSDEDIAKELRERYWQAMRVAADVMDEARKHGMLIQFGGIQADQFGRHFVPAVGVVKML